MTNPVYTPEISYFGAGPDDPVIDLNDAEELILKKLRSQLKVHAQTNLLKQNLYEASQVVKHLDIAVPRLLSDIGTAIGWGGTVVDVIDERIDWLGWETPDGKLDGLDDIFIDNDLAVESSYGHLDALTTGVTFASVGNNEDGGQLICVESSSNATVLWDYRKRRSIAGLGQTVDSDGNIIMETLYLENSTVTFQRDPIDKQMEVTGRDNHNIGRCFMTRLVNKARPHQIDGRSELTRAVRYYVDAAVRTALGMEVNREFYTAPQRAFLNAKPEDFGITEGMTQAEKAQRGLTLAMGMINIIPPADVDSQPVSSVEFKSQPPTPYIEQIKAYSVLLSAETGMPVEYFGFTTDNPPSADSIRQREYRLVKRASRRIGSFGVGWREVALLSLLARDGQADTDFMRSVRCAFEDPSTPTRAATADEVQKLTASAVLVPDSAVTYRRVGLSKADQIELEADKVKAEAKARAQAQLDHQMAMDQAAAAKPPAAPGQPGKPSATKKPPVTSTGSAQ